MYAMWFLPCAHVDVCISTMLISIRIDTYHVVNMQYLVWHVWIVILKQAFFASKCDFQMLSNNSIQHQYSGIVAFQLTAFCIWWRFTCIQTFCGPNPRYTCVLVTFYMTVYDCIWHTYDMTYERHELRDQACTQALSNVYGHITLKIPVLVWSLKSSNVEPS